MKIKLVLSGSGVLYPVHVGAVIRLLETGYEIEEVIGTSGGSIVAAGIASGLEFGKDELTKLVKSIVPGKLLDFGLWSSLTKWGLYKGNKIQKIFSQHFASTLGGTQIPLHIVTTCLNKKSVRVFSSDTDPDFPTALAVRASISVPGIFIPVKIDNEIYVDGGVMANFMIDYFGADPSVIGLRIGGSGLDTPINDVIQYGGASIESAVAAAESARSSSNKIISLYSKFGSFDFKIGEKEIVEMIEEGYSSVVRWEKGL